MNYQLFAKSMKRIKFYVYSALIALIFFSWIFSNSNEKNENFSETVKVALREVGNQLLLSNKDSTSLVLPIVELKKNKFKLSFQNQLSFEPARLVEAVKNVFQKADLPNYYSVSVVQCSDREVAYSFLIKNQSEKDIIPCSGRFLPNNCYTIEVKFTNKLSKQVLLGLLLFTILIFFIDYKLSTKKQIEKEIKVEEKHTKIGVFQFYPEQNKLVKQATEINLSKKECELLAIFVANPNQVIKRDELTKRVWEDHGVFVGRSLDTYISKLRKKLKDDETIKLINVHGVGYKMQVNSLS